MKNKTLKIHLLLLILFFFNNSYAAEVPIYTIEGRSLKVINNGSIIISEGNSKAINNEGKKILSENIIYNKKNLTIETKSNSVFLDEEGNKLYANEFLYDLKSRIISAKGAVKYHGQDGNIFYFDNLKYNEQLKKGSGNNFSAKLLDKSTINSRLAEFDNIKKILSLGNNEKNKFLFNPFSNNVNYYTSCQSAFDSNKKINEVCPDWSLTSKRTLYNKNKKMLYHYGTLLKIKNVPIFYTPYFAHPDPSVKRKSGILPPVSKNFTDLGQTIKTPYFWAIDDNSDMTITPIYYFNENNLYLTEYRKQNQNSSLIIDTSFTKGYKYLNKIDSSGNSIRRTGGSRNHLFAKFLGSYDNLVLDKNDIEINLQNISHKNYLKVHQINTNQVKQDTNLLNSNLLINSYKDNKKISFQTNIFKDLNIENKNEKYQYLLPGVEYSDFFKKFDLNFNIINSFLARNFGGDSNQVSLINKIEANSDQKISKNIIPGLSTVYKGSVNNINYYNENISNKKENLNQNIFLTNAIETSYPLIKSSENKEEIILPKTFAKYTTGKMENANTDDKKLTYNDIFSMNRMQTSTNPETGVSLGYGLEYDNIIKNNENKVYKKISASIGQVLKPKTLNEMPDNSSLKEKRSSFVGNISLLQNNKVAKNDTSLNEFDINYSYTLDKNLNKFLKNSVKANYLSNQNNYSLDFYETNEIGDEHYVSFKYQRNFENNINFMAGIKKNLKDNFTENNYLGINYDTDCINIGITLSKEFFQNEELKPSNNLTLSFTFKPFGKPLSPDLSSFLK